MTELTVKDLLASGRPLHRADVLTVAEVLAHQLADEHSQAVVGTVTSGRTPCCSPSPTQRQRECRTPG